MRKALPQMLDLSRQLIACEGGKGHVSAAAVCERLRPKLSTLMGATGYRALLARALALACAEMPSLCDFEIDSAHALVRRTGAGGDTVTAGDIDGEVVLVAQLLGLLVAFIGETLTRQILLELWPRSFGQDSPLETGDSA